MPVSRAFLGTAQAAETTGFSFVQISDSHIGFAKPANPHADVRVLDTICSPTKARMAALQRLLPANLVRRYTAIAAGIAVACVVAAPTASCTDTGLTNGTAYYYKIFAKDTNGNYATVHRWIESLPREQVVASVALCLCAFITGLDNTVLNIALPKLQADLKRRGRWRRQG